MVAVPAFHGTIQLPTADLLLLTMLDCAVKGWGFERRWRPGNPDIAQLRDIIATVDFLESDCTDLIFLDSDVGAAPGAVAKLCSQPVDFVAAPVPFRTDPLDFPIRWIQERPQLVADPNTGLIEVEGIGMALTRLTRAAIITMVEAYPQLRFRCPSARSGFATALFYPELETGGARWSEDYSFCRRYRAIGGNVWIDPEIGTSHTGIKTFEGHMGNWLRDRDRATDSMKGAYEMFPGLEEILKATA